MPCHRPYGSSVIEPDGGLIELRSDNSVGVAPEIMAAIAAADIGGTMAYGADPWTARLHERVADVFEHDDVLVFPVASGTAANALGLLRVVPAVGCGAVPRDGAHRCQRGRGHIPVHERSDEGPAR